LIEEREKRGLIKERREGEEGESKKGRGKKAVS
jgi:hypothetical protein